MYEKINDPIDVIAYFPPNGQFRPLRLRWQDQVYKPLKIHSSWNIYQSSSKHYYFEVSSGNTDKFELVFDSGEMTWQIHQVYVEG